MLNRTKITFIILLFYGIKTVSAQTTFYTLNSIQKIELTFNQPNWDYQLDTAALGATEYIVAASIKINGIAYDSVGVKYKGNSSFDSTYKKNPVHIALDEYKTQSYQGISSIKLSNCYADPSLIREVLSYQILKKYMDCPRSNFAQLYVNGNYIGLYSNDESINKNFCESYFNSNDNTLVKCNPIINPGTAAKCNLKYITSDTADYQNYYEIKSDTGWNELIQLCNTITNTPAELENSIDIDRTIWMLAFDNVLVNLDSYMGAFCQNYYLYKDNYNRFNPIVWDLNMSFGSFPFAGTPGNGLGGLNLAGMQQLPATLHATQTDWPLINDIMNNALYKRMYFAHVRTIINENFANGAYQTLASELQNLIDSAAKSDSNNFYTYTQFQNGMTSNVANGSYTIPGIATLMNVRTSYLQSTSDFVLSSPKVKAVLSSNNSPALNQTIFITANISNAISSTVYVGYRFNPTAKYTKVLMFDDGLHNDGIANDSVYGVGIEMLTEELQYYIYAENSNAGTFYPAGAEHDFFTVSVPRNIPQKGEIVINEFLASNDKSDINEYGIYTDWIELYNTTSKKLSLFGMYISDDEGAAKKFAFPGGTYIEPNSYFGVWADGLNTKKYVHSNFKLSSDGGIIVLCNNSGEIYDSVSYKVQSQDTSIGRCPDGSGSFIFINTPTFMGKNSSFCIANQAEISQQNIFTVYPNPANAHVNFFSSNKKVYAIEITNMFGQQLSLNNVVAGKLEISTAEMNSGIYIYKAMDKNNLLLHTGKIVVLK